MRKFFSKMKKNKKGYTLTELIVVVAILGVLAAIAVPSVMSAIDSSKKQADITSMKAIETAVQVCLADGTLTMGQKTDASTGVKYSLIQDENGGEDETKISNAVKAKLKGNEYPKHAADSSMQWSLVLRSGQVEEVSGTTTSSAGQYTVLD